ncbi:helix-turn-helix domain-containing protein [Nocardioides terrisoli]|uniref:helix-turn-helix domain-containing protein n=1 Tax=Nocardioides terrisoli TaxID=3388267 RepID=UPI00287B7691|nr:leucine zipper domain-containing protein [Nocardioides marmorisolisilvae]
MTLNRLLITSVVVENRPVREVAAQYGVSESWLFELLARYKTEGDSAFEPRSRRPHSVPTTIPTEAVELILELREKLTATGLDAGPDTIKWHLEHHHSTVVSRATISRYLAKHGLVTPEPKKKPKSSYIRFAAEMPNETWQSDMQCRRRHWKSYADLRTMPMFLRMVFAGAAFDAAWSA